VSPEPADRQISSNADIVRVSIVTSHHRIEGDLHCPRIGKAGRNLSRLLNSNDLKRTFLALTNVVIQTADGTPREALPFIEVNTQTIDYLYPITAEDLDDSEDD
jgi:hypothetical protein